MAQKIFSSVAIVFILCSGFLASAFAGPIVHADGSETLPMVGAVLPDPLPVDTSAAAFSRVQTTREIVIIGEAPKARAKVWTCGAARHLENDASQTVRACEWR